jgi:ABC-type ATPase with predicted acetyltransferase domain
VGEHKWSPSRSLLDDFPAKMSIEDVTKLLTSVGFSSPPSWLRPFKVLSTGEQFRAHMARCLAEGDGDTVVVDEFTSVVDRQVAKVVSHCVQKTVRRRKSQQLVAVSCHHDVVDWLQPDWILNPHTGLKWRSPEGHPPLRSKSGPLGAKSGSSFGSITI